MLPELHETIQIAFDWTDTHLHCFEANRTNGISLRDRNISIGINDDEFFDMVEYDFEEGEEKLSEWLIKEKDKLIYIYDFGDYWRHEITLEKTLQPEAGRAYPFCVKAMRAPAMEDSGGFVDEAKEVDSKELLAEINDGLQRNAKEIGSIQSAAVRGAKGQWNRLFQLAKEYNELAPWRWLYDDQIIAIEIPGTGEYAYCSVMGALGEEFGLAAFIGNDGLEYLKGIMENSRIDQDSIYDNRSLVLSLCDRDELAQKDYELIKREGFTFRGKKKWPMFRSLIPGYYPWELTVEETEWFSVILERVIGVCTRAKNGLEILEFGLDDVCFGQSVSENQKGWEDTYISTIGEQEAVEPGKLLVSEIEVQRIKYYKKFNVPLEIGAFYSPHPIQENPEERPFFPIVFVGAERKRQMIVFHDMLTGKNREAEIQAAFIKLIGTLQAVPREVWITTENFLILKPLLKELKISVMHIERLPIIEEVKTSMFQFSS